MRNRIQKTEVRRQEWNFSESTDSSHSSGMTASRNFVWGNYIDECLLFIYNSESAPERYYYLHDHLYSPAAVVDAYGTVGQRYEYDAYGKRQVLSSQFSALSSSYYLALFGLTGREVDMLDYDSQRGYGLQHMHYRHRDYSPAIGRFMQQDPWGGSMDFVLDNNLNMFEQYTDGMNLYAYCRNQPGFLMDPWGLISIWTPVGPGYDRIIDGFMQCYKEALRQVKNAEKQPWYGDHKTMHCVVACELTKKEGTACAWAAGFGHKLGEKFRDYKRDRNAEAVGRDCGNAPSVCGEAPNKSCEECCQDKGQTDSRG